MGWLNNRIMKEESVEIDPSTIDQYSSAVAILNQTKVMNATQFVSNAMKSNRLNSCCPALTVVTVGTAGRIFQSRQREMES